MTGKIFRSIMAVVAVTLVACVLIIMGCLYEYFCGIQNQRLWTELDLAATGVEISGSAYLDALDTGRNRLTWISANGLVLYDAQADRAVMENHADREEVQQAFLNGTGSSARYSDTLLEKTVYCAKRLSDGSVLRISIRHATIGVLAMGMLQPIGMVLLLALCLALWLANRLARRIVQPLNTLDLDHPLENQTYPELAPLLRRINQQRGQIDTQLCQLQQKKDEFTQITDNMNEGLVVLDRRGTIVSINPAAKRLFHVGTFVQGKDFLAVERCRELSDVIALAKERGQGECLLERNGRSYQVNASSILSDDIPVGVVLLAFDVTEKKDAERMRREFTANVSHELKTPLTAILGSSEMIEKGMVRQEDVERFVGHIHEEAARLLAMIEDVLRLSQLDEGILMQKEAVDLAAVAQDTVKQLESKAAQYGVTVWIFAEPCLVSGVFRLIQEIVYNLTENAIKYNKPGGSVTLTVTPDGILTVTDTGIGISIKEQQRVFERFYRVDKSHSKTIGGTGLGLSIVKHAAAYLGAEIALQSTEGKGTTVRVAFRRAEF